MSNISLSSDVKRANRIYCGRSFRSWSLFAKSSLQSCALKKKNFFSDDEGEPDDDDEEDEDDDEEEDDDEDDVDEEEVEEEEEEEEEEESTGNKVRRLFIAIVLTQVGSS